MERITFRPTRATAAFFASIFLLPAALLAVLLLADSVEPESVALAILVCLFFFSLGVYCGAGLFCLRIVADEEGLRRVPRWFGCDRVRWSDIVAWSVRPSDPIDAPDGCQALELVVRDQFWTMRVLDYEADRPGFDLLLELVRTRCGAPQVHTPGGTNSNECLLPERAATGRSGR